MNIAGKEVVGVTCIILHIKIAILTGSKSFGVVAEDAFGLITVEESYRVTHRCKDVMIAIDRCCVISIRQLCNFVHIMTDTCT